jgi:hypothetical protein
MAPRAPFPGTPPLATLTASKLALAICALAMLGGCAVFEKRWPDAGTGGFGEYYATPDPRAHVLGERLADLEARNARSLAAAEFDEGSLLYVRIKREVAAGHLEDAAANMDRLDALADRMERRIGRARGAR